MADFLDKKASEYLDQFKQQDAQQESFNQKSREIPLSLSQKALSMFGDSQPWLHAHSYLLNKMRETGLSAAQVLQLSKNNKDEYFNGNGSTGVSGESSPIRHDTPELLKFAEQIDKDRLNNPVYYQKKKKSQFNLLTNPLQMVA